MDGSVMCAETSALPLARDSLNKAIKVEKEEFLESDASSANTSFIPFLTGYRIKTEVCDDEEDLGKNVDLVIEFVTSLAHEAGETSHAPKAGTSMLLQRGASDVVKREKADVGSSTRRMSPTCTVGRSIWMSAVRQNAERKRRRCNLALKEIGLRGAKPYSVKLTRDVFKKHKALGERAYHCERCGRGFLQNGAFKRHRRMHTTGNLYGCDFNERMFRIYGSLSYYWKRDKGGMWYLCKGYGKAYLRTNQLGCHQGTQSSEKSFGTLKQSKASLFTQLKNEQRIHRGENCHRCEKCGEAFSKVTKLNGHQCIHRQETPHCCKVCNKVFSHAKHLNNHQHIHMRDKPFICKECGKAFSQVTHINNHWRIHTGEKPFHCKMCEKAFSQVTNLNNHYRTHTGEKPYQCQICGKAFTQVTNLNNHYRTHTGEKPFRCKMCDKAFSQVANLNSHQRIHHPK